MGRPWEYPLWRRVLMQGLMWVVLAGTVGLAQLVTQHQKRHTTVTLGAPIRLGPIYVRVPKGWAANKTVTTGESVIEAVDGETRRVLSIFVMQVPPDDDDQSVDARNGVDNGASEPITFRGLGLKSSMRVGRENRQAEDGVITTTSLNAIVRLPSGSTVVVELDEIGTHLASADKSLLRAAADAITLAPRRPDARPAATRSGSADND